MTSCFPWSSCIKRWEVAGKRNQRDLRNQISCSSFEYIIVTEETQRTNMSTDVSKRNRMIGFY